MQYRFNNWRTEWALLDHGDRWCLTFAFACLSGGFGLGFMTAWGWP